MTKIDLSPADYEGHGGDATGASVANVCPNCGLSWETIRECVPALKAEIERLRAALEQIAAQHSDKYGGYPEAEADRMAHNDLAEIAEDVLSGT